MRRLDITISIDLGQVHLGHDLLPVGADLHQLLVHLGRIDVGQQIALGDAAADVLVPAQQIAVGASVDRRLFVSLQAYLATPVPRQAFLRSGWMTATVGMDARSVSLCQHMAVVDSHEHGDQAANDQQQQHKANQQQRLARRRRRKLGRRRYLRRLAFVVQDFGSV